eukprot:jgi/Psemu1/22469/gm1.22469_g
MEQKIKQLRLFAILTGIAAFAFWVWAILNTVRNEAMRNGFDLGVISFLTVMCTSSYVLYLTRTNSERLRDTCTTGLVVASHALVALNYAGGIVFAFAMFSPVKIGFGIYCIVFMNLWIGSAGLGWRLLKQHGSSEGVNAGIDISQFDDDDHDVA